MAEVMNRIALQILSKCRNLNILHNFSVIGSTAPSRSYARSVSRANEPIIPKDDQKTVLESEAFKEIALLPVRSALNYYSSSMFLDPKVMQFVNYVMEDGKKAVARKLVGDAFAEVKRIQVSKYNRAKPESREYIQVDPLKIFHKGIENAKPHLKLVRIRLGATWYQVPRAITDKNAETRSMKWFVEVVNSKPSPARFYKVLAKELIDASEYKGQVINKKIELHKLCEANKAYAHFRWS